ncbi:hypothetical protein Mapa_012723 [Marchantia paleacea]|nr:hypothetical protein Mapa_012723 [Marchantia paleacea]
MSQLSRLTTNIAQVISYNALVRYQISDDSPGCHSLRNNMFELADRLIGIYKTDNCTKSITINPKSFAVPAPEI